MSPEAYDGYSKYGELEADTYDALRDSEPLWRFENDHVEAYFASHHPATILDLPVGTGRFLHFYPKQAEIVGLDISESMLAAARRKCEALALSDVSLRRGDIFALDLPSRHFETVVCFRLLHLLPADRLAPALAELGRVTKGTLMAQAYVHGSPLRRIASRAARLVGRVLGIIPRQHPLRSSQHIEAFNHSRATFEVAFAQAGLRVRSDTLLGHYFGHEVRVFMLEQRA